MRAIRKHQNPRDGDGGLDHELGGPCHNGGHVRSDRHPVQDELIRLEVSLDLGRDAPLDLRAPEVGDGGDHGRPMPQLFDDPLGGLGHRLLHRAGKDPGLLRRRELDTARDPGRHVSQRVIESRLRYHGDRLPIQFFPAQLDRGEPHRRVAGAGAEAGD